MTADEQVATAFLTDHPDDAARIIERLNPSDAAAILSGLKAGVAANVFRVMGPAPAAACTATMDDATVASLIDELPLDDASIAMRAIDEARHPAILDRMEAERREQLHRALAWQDQTAGAMADPLVLALTDDLTVADAQKQLRDPRQHLFYYVYVVARDSTLVGVVAIPELMAARPRANLRDVMLENPVRLDASADLATVAMHPAWRDYDALPVVDREGRLVGAIRHKAIRRIGWAPGVPLTETLVRLSEAYWAGLSGMLHTLTPQRGSRGGHHES